MLTYTGYYFTHLVSATHFINTLDSSCLSIDPLEFQRKMDSPLISNAEATKSTSKPEATPGVIRSISTMDLINLDGSVNTDTEQKTPKHSILPHHNAPAAPTTYRFIDSMVEELRIGDVGQLLEEYKKLVKENQQLRSFLVEAMQQQAKS